MGQKKVDPKTFFPDRTQFRSKFFSDLEETFVRFKDTSNVPGKVLFSEIIEL